MKNEFREDLGIRYGDLTTGEGMEEQYDLIFCIWVVPHIEMLKRFDASENLVKYTREDGYIVTECGVYQKVDDKELKVLFDPYTDLVFTPSGLHGPERDGKRIHTGFSDSLKILGYDLT